MKRHRSDVNTMIGRKVRLTARHHKHCGRAGIIVQVFMKPAYVVCLKDGRLVESNAKGVVLES